MAQTAQIERHAGRSISFAILGNALAGTSGTAAALYGFSDSGPVVGFVRLIIGAISLLILAPFFGATFRGLRRILKRPGVWIMAISSATYQAFFFQAVDRSGVATAALVTVGCVPISAGIVGWLALSERPNKIWFISTTIALAGLIIRSADELKINNASGIIFAVIAGTGIGAYLNAAKVEVRAGANVMLLPGTAYLLGSFGLIALIRSDLLEVSWNTTAIITALYLGVITMGLANAFQILSLHGISPGVAATMMLADPLGAALLGIFVIGEKLNLQGAIGLALVLLGLILQSFSPNGSQPNKIQQGRHKK